MNRSGAEFSLCKRYRYVLWREWGSGPFVTWIGLNPSTADELTDDPTIRRCIGFAKTWGYQGIRMLNLFAFRATLPKIMMRASDPVGPDNDQTILRYCSDPSSRLIVACWGKDGKHRSRGWEIRKKLLVDFPLKCLGKNKDGEPKHPLYLKGDIQLCEV